jgi:hypothetical protein
LDEEALYSFVLGWGQLPIAVFFFIGGHTPRMAAVHIAVHIAAVHIAVHIALVDKDTHMVELENNLPKKRGLSKSRAKQRRQCQ